MQPSSTQISVAKFLVFTIALIPLAPGSALAAGLLSGTDFGAFAVSVSILILFVAIPPVPGLLSGAPAN